MLNDPERNHLRDGISDYERILNELDDIANKLENKLDRLEDKVNEHEIMIEGLGHQIFYLVMGALIYIGGIAYTGHPMSWLEWLKRHFN